MSTETLATLGLLLTLILALIGYCWRVISLRRSELRERVAKIEILIREYEEKASLYWTRKLPKNEAIQLAAEIKSLRHQIGMEITRLRKNCKKCGPEPLESFLVLHKEATKHPFESDTRSVEPERVTNIHNAANQLIQALRDQLKII